ncbi:MAG: fused MFS/spermidine synthase [Pseudomonadota bacterium]
MNRVLAAPARAARQSATQFGASPYIATVFLSAALVFLVQPIFAKMATPLLGGAPNVWNVSLVCFQAALLLGYAYAHLLNHLVVSLRAQIGIHAGLLALAALVLPFQLSGALGTPDPTQPTLWLIGVFALSIAPPFAVIAATAPLIQIWYSRSGRDDAHDPYHLYSASNIGSLIGLMAYPLLLEPLLPVALQTSAWTAGYGVLSVLLLASGLVALATGNGAPPAIADADAPAATPRTEGRWRQRLWWLACAFVPSSLLVGVTTHISTDIASVPFLWALPLILYISTFIIVFSKRPAIRLSVSVRLLSLAVAVAFLALSSLFSIPLLFALVLHLFVLFLAAMVGHGALAEDRPEANRLTEFYLIMSLGGVLGGAFNALLVPVIFTSVIEYPLGLVAILLIRPGLRWMGQSRTRLWTAAAIIALTMAAALRLIQGDEITFYLPFRILNLIAIVGIVMTATTRAGPAVTAACALGISMLASPASNGMSDRSFFGVVKIFERGEHRLLMHGTTVHGAQFLAEDKKLQPTTYYAPATPIGQVFSSYTGTGHIGAVGLGTGSVACYAQPGQTYTFYEIDPLVAKYAQDPAYFTYLSECTPDAEIVLGDGRLTLAAEPAGQFDLLLIDAFSSDSIPVHLLTLEAIELYLSRLSDDGVLMIHVSNKYLSLEPVVVRIAERLNVPALYQFYIKAPEEKGDAFSASSSQVVVLARDPAALAHLKQNDAWVELESDGGRPWTDDYSNVIGAIIDKQF